MRIAGLLAVPAILVAAALTAQAPLPAPDPFTEFSDNCAACHQPDGKGIEGAFPALAGDRFVLGAAAEPIKVVLDGRAGMPAFRIDLSDAQIAAALTYVRTSWGNKAPPVATADVAALRGNVATPKNSGH